MRAIEILVGQAVDLDDPLGEQAQHPAVARLPPRGRNQGIQAAILSDDEDDTLAVVNVMNYQGRECGTIAARAQGCRWRCNDQESTSTAEISVADRLLAGRNMTGERHTLRSDKITATIAANGAELCSLQNADGLELLWQAGTAWPRHAPLLVPIIGRLKNDQPQHRGKIYPMTQ